MLILVIVTLLFAGEFLHTYLRSDIIGGWDGTNHYAISKFYSRHIFPKPFGWTHNWNAGMPWPLGYPPLFYYALSVLDRLVPVDFLDLFQGCAALGVFVLPCLIYAICRRLAYSRAMSLFSSILSILFLTIPQSIAGSAGGITLQSTFGSGLYPHFFGSLVMFAWLFVFLNAEDSRRSRFFSIVLLGMVLLANIHAGEAALVIFGCFAMIRLLQERNLATLRFYSTHLIFSLLLIAFWALPLLTNLDYFLTKTFDRVHLLGIVQSHYALAGILLATVAAVTACARRDGRVSALSLSGIVILAITVFPIKIFFPGLPIQPFRLLPVSYLLMIIAAPYAVARLVRAARLGEWCVRAALAAMLLPLMLFSRPTSSTLSLPFIADDERELIEFAQTLNDGRSMVEVYAPGFPAHYNLAALLGAEGDHQTIWNVFRESGINAPFVVPLRNAFSNRHEDFGVVTMLAGPTGGPFYRQPLLTQLKRARLYFLNYFIIRHKRLARLFLASRTAALKKATGGWFVFEATEPSPVAEALRFEPAVVFTTLNSTNRSYAGMDAYDWLRLSEEWFYRADFDTVLVLAKEPHLDTTSDLDRFTTAVVIDCRYKNLEKATTRLKTYCTEGGKIIFFVPPNHVNPLAKRLKESQHGARVVILQKSGDVRGDTAKLLAVLGKFRTPLRTRPELKEVRVDQERIQMKTSAAKGDTSRIYLKNSYFPLWRDLYGGEVYMASPALTLILTDEPQIDMVFERGFFFWLGLAVSLTTLGVLIARLICHSGSDEV